MSHTPDNVTPINPVENEETQPVIRPSGNGGNMDLSKIAIVISLLSVVLSVIFFFGLNRNLSGLSHEVSDIGVIRSNVEALDAYVDDILAQMGRVNTRIMELEEKPRREAVRVLQESMIDDMLRRAEFMGGQLAQVAPDDAETAEKLERLKAVLQEFSAPVAAVEIPAGDSVQAEEAPVAVEQVLEQPSDGSAPQSAADQPAAPLVDSPPAVEQPVTEEPLAPSVEESEVVPAPAIETQVAPAPAEDSEQLVPAPPVHQLVPAPAPARPAE